MAETALRRRQTPLARRLIAGARTCLGTPFRHQGREPGLGLDCIGVIVVAARAAGFHPRDRRDYGRIPRGTLLETALVAAGLRPVDPAEAVPGDVLVFTLDRWPRHVALRTGRGMIHAWGEVGRVVEHRLSPDWADALTATYRFPGV
ncbi:hypothetical protein CCR85_03520 [Rhodothalassium salexigens]|uniref:NlpC/P60 family protein n=1 Tax=Rhodothalassium salexigens TaxID=1086 RepID=UPI00191408B3|nr:NlpC/P60 family protein [Rhodothalassium salexigens]MBK5910560.1 hypothetical protein [Rhodothalassium salexigens]MBK5920236.1 hypothetical protein [Rhodothalassium salexigens]